MSLSLEDSLKIQSAGVNDVFTPSHPIDTNTLFSGRTDESNKIISGMAIKNLHCILYGDRGVGKSSLALYSCRELVSNFGFDQFIQINCTSSTTYAKIVGFVLQRIGVEITTGKTVIRKGSLAAKQIGIGAEVKKDILMTVDIEDPSWLVEIIRDLKIIIMIDEFDTIQNHDETSKISSLIKGLSDHSSSCRVFIVGIARSVNDLVDAHLSIVRCVEEVKLNRMTDEELSLIIQKGEARLGISFDEDVKNEIIRISHGYPYYTHLLSFYSASEAICKDLLVVSMEEYKAGLDEAKSSVEETLRNSYKTFVGIHDNYLKRSLLYAAAQMDDTITNKRLRIKYSEIFKATVSPPEVNYNFFNVGKTSKVIMNTGRAGEYVFSDPRMPSYVILLGIPTK